MPVFEYLGPHDGVDLTGHGTVQRGDTVDATAALADELRGTPESWRETKPRAKKPTNKSEES